MCDCPDPIRHSCGNFMVFDGEIGDSDVYFCNACDCQVVVACKMTRKKEVV